MGYLVLQGGSEFSGQMRESDLKAMALAGGASAAIRIIPAAAAPDRNHINAGNNGCAWFQSLGATDVEAVALTDRSTAEDAITASRLAGARLIYMLGGFPGHLAESIAGTASWSAMLAAYRAGGVLAGSSAGAMVLCQHLFDPQSKSVVPGLGMIPDACLIPHYNRYGDRWVSVLQKELPRASLIGIDEQTGMISDGRPLP